MSWDIPIGTEFAGYRIMGVLGHGGMSVVYAAEHFRLKRMVALKLLSPALAADETFRDRFTRESHIAAVLDHPNIIPIYDADEAEGFLYIAMRRVEGDDLRTLLEEERALSLEQTLFFIGQVAGALDHAHEHGLVHRDVKPANILIARPSNHVYLADFGVAKQSSAPGLTKTGHFIGTFEYAAPEQIEGRSVDGRTDLYGLGCVLYHCLAGGPPFQTDTEAAVIRAHLVDPPPKLTDERPDLPQAINHVVATAMAKTKEDRYSSCEEFMSALRAIAPRTPASGKGTIAAEPPPTLRAPSTFPPLQTFPSSFSSRLTNLPAQPTPFLGREQELEQLKARLCEEQVRLLTLTGPGGVGKTRLALQAAAEAAERYPDGVFWVPLAPLREPELILPTMGQALGAKDGLAEHIADRSMLLLLDNFEQVVEAAEDLSELLALCPNLQLLVTSRELLRLPGEHAFPVPPLEPRDGRDLFLARAWATKPDFRADDAVQELCARLENLPLALELAAARIRVLSPNQLLARLSHRLDLLKAGRGVDPRQQTLRATIEWSHDLLDEDEQQLFARLAVFRGGCLLEAAEDVCDAEVDTLQSLVDKSLLRRREDRAGRPRFSMLETIREYGQEKLQASGEADESRRRQADYLLKLVQQAGKFTGAKQKEWLDRFEEEHDNLRAALDFLEAIGDAETALLLATGVTRFWWLHGHSREGRSRLERSLAIGDAPAPVRARSLSSLAMLALFEGDLERARRFGEDALALYEDLGDKSGIGNALTSLGRAAVELGELDEAARVHTRALALFRELGERHRISVALTNLTEVALQRGDYEISESNAREVLAIGQELGDEQVMAIALQHLGLAALGRNRPEEAGERFSESLALSRELEPRLAISALLGLAAVLTSDPEAAIRVLAASEAIAEAINLMIERTEQGLLERTLAGCQEALGEKRLEELREEGRQMSLDAAADYALERARMLEGSAT